MKWFAISLVVLFAAGCNALDAESLKLPWADDKTSAYDEPTTMIVIWKDAVYTRTGSPPMRGFGGRIYFYDKESKAIPVDGELVVYGYDDTNPDYNNRKPQKKFVFTAEQFTQRYSETDLGASYSVWLPWEELGGPERQVTLYPLFKTASGQLLHSTPNASTNVLPGRGREASEPQRRGFYSPNAPEPQRPYYTPGSADPQARPQAGVPRSGVQQIGYDEAEPVSQDPRRNTTIRLTPALAERIAKARIDAEQAQQSAAKAASNQRLRSLQQRLELLKPSGGPAPTQRSVAPTAPSNRSGNRPPAVRQVGSERFQRTQLSSAGFTGIQHRGSASARLQPGSATGGQPQSGSPASQSQAQSEQYAPLNPAHLPSLQPRGGLSGRFPQRP